jgi:hypothetical protein
MEKNIHALITSASDADNWSASYCGPLYHQENSLDTQRIEEWCSLVVILDQLYIKFIFLTHRPINGDHFQ